MSAVRKQWATSRADTGSGISAVPSSGTTYGSNARLPFGLLQSLTHRATQPSTGLTDRGRSDHISPAISDANSIRQQPLLAFRCQPRDNTGSLFTGRPETGSAVPAV